MNTWVLARREWKAAFETPIAYVILALFPAVTAAFFLVIGPFFQEANASLRRFFELIPFFLVLVAPAITMRMWAEEKRSGTEELLMTYPFKISQLVLGKFLGAWGLLTLALLMTLGLPLTVQSLGSLDWGPVVGGYIGACMLAASCAAVGLFVSSLTRNQIVAWIFGAAVLLLFNVIGTAATATAMPPAIGELFLALDFGYRFASITRGVLDLGDLVFYGAVTFLFLCFNGLVMEQRRWR